MSLVFWRSVNGYMYPSNVNACGGAGYYTYMSASPGVGPHSTSAAGSQAAQAATCLGLSPLSATSNTLPSALALAASVTSNPTVPANPAHKWIMPSYLSSQQMYMFLPKTNKPRTERVNKSVKCEICNLTLNSELQAQQHYNGKNHLKKMKQQGMPPPSDDDNKRVSTPCTSEGGSQGKPNCLDSEDPEESEGRTEESLEPQSSRDTETPVEQTLQEDQHVQVQEQKIQTHQQHSPLPLEPKLDPVSQAVYENVLGRLPRKRKMEIPCSVCEMIFNSEAQASQHFRGVKHAKRLKMAEDLKAPAKSPSDGQNQKKVSKKSQPLGRGCDDGSGCQPGTSCDLCDINVEGGQSGANQYSNCIHHRMASEGQPDEEAPNSPGASSS